jgi:hypothetical protein
MYIPPEIHQMIVPFLSNSELCSYRLVSKVLADIVVGVLFRVVKFHANRESVAGLESLADDATLRTNIQNLVWDTNRWDLFPAREGRETRYFNKPMGRRPTRFTQYSSDADLPLDDEADPRYLALREVHHERYLRRVQEEHELLADPGALCLSALRETLASLPKPEVDEHRQWGYLL